jgi:phage baseplate assembly protein W
MMNIQGSTISFPFRSDVRGTIATTANRDEIIAQAIADIIETRKGERVMMPEYGLPDWIFAVQSFGFAARIAFHLEEQILNYVPLMRSVIVQAATDEQHRAVVELKYILVGEINAPRNLVFPVWQYFEAGI